MKRHQLDKIFYSAQVGQLYSLMWLIISYEKYICRHTMKCFNVFLDLWEWMKGWILTQTFCFPSSWRPEEGSVILFTTTLLASCPGCIFFNQNLSLLPPAVLLLCLLLYQQHLGESRAVSIRRACLESQPRRNKPFKNSPGVASIK